MVAVRRDLVVVDGEPGGFTHGEHVHAVDLDARNVVADNSVSTGGKLARKTRGDKSSRYDRRDKTSQFPGCNTRRKIAARGHVTSSEKSQLMTSRVRGLRCRNLTSNPAE